MRIEDVIKGITTLYTHEELKTYETYILKNRYDYRDAMTFLYACGRGNNILNNGKSMKLDTVMKLYEQSGTHGNK